MRWLKLFVKQPGRAFWFVQGHILWYLHKKAILKFLKKSIECEPCYKSGFCVHCGCAVGPVFMSSMKCKK